MFGLGLDYGLGFSSDIQLRQDPQLRVSHLAKTRRNRAAILPHVFPRSHSKLTESRFTDTLHVHVIPRDWEGKQSRWANSPKV